MSGPGGNMEGGRACDEEAWEAGPESGKRRLKKTRGPSGAKTEEGKEDLAYGPFLLDFY